MLEGQQPQPVLAFGVQQDIVAIANQVVEKPAVVQLVYQNMVVLGVSLLAEGLPNIAS